MDIDDHIAANLERIIKAKGTNPRAVAIAARMGPTGVRDIITRRTVHPTYWSLCKIARALDVDVSEILGHGQSTREDFEDEPSFLSVPRYDVQLAAGAGRFNSEYAEILDHIPFTEPFIRQKLGRSTTEDLICCDAYGDSMEPTINDGDLLIVDLRRKEQAAGIYAVNYGEESFVKRVEKLDNGYSLVSENRAYPPIVIKGQQVDALNIIGKVVWAGRTLVSR